MSRCVLLTSWTIPSSKHSIPALYSSLLLCSWTSEASGLSWWSYLFMMCGEGGVGPCYLNPNSSGISSVGEVPHWGVDMSRTKCLLNKAVTMITSRVCAENIREMRYFEHHIAWWGLWLFHSIFFQTKCSIWVDVYALVLHHSWSRCTFIQALYFEAFWASCTLLYIFTRLYFRGKYFTHCYIYPSATIGSWESLYIVIHKTIADENQPENQPEHEWGQPCKCFVHVTFSLVRQLPSSLSDPLTEVIETNQMGAWDSQVSVGAYTAIRGALRFLGPALERGTRNRAGQVAKGSGLAACCSQV